MNVDNTSASGSKANSADIMNSPGNDASSIKNEFMTLMIAQIQNQDPTNPIDSTEYVSQLAQFSQVESLEQMRLNQANQMVKLENQSVIQSAQLIGKDAMVPASNISLGTEKVQGKVYIANATEDLSVDILDHSGQVVSTMKLGPQKTGDIEFSIDPKALGLRPGEYSIEAKATSGKEVLTADTFIQGQIEKIHFASASGMMMAELGNGLGTVSVLEISEVS